MFQRQNFVITLTLITVNQNSLVEIGIKIVLVVKKTGPTKQAQSNAILINYHYLLTYFLVSFGFATSKALITSFETVASLCVAFSALSRASLKEKKTQILFQEKFKISKTIIIIYCTS